MTVDDDADMLTVNAAWGSYQVRRGSPAAMAFDPQERAREKAALVERGRMSWSLGTELSDLLWMLVPEMRPSLIELCTEALVEGEHNDEFLSPVSHYDVCNALYLEVLAPAVTQSEVDRDLVLRCLVVLHRVIGEADGDSRWETVDRIIVRPLEARGLGDLLTEIRPEFMGLVHQTRAVLGQA